jgi:hypothetical protein
MPPNRDAAQRKKQGAIGDKCEHLGGVRCQPLRLPGDGGCCGLVFRPLRSL